MLKHKSIMIVNSINVGHDWFEFRNFVVVDNLTTLKDGDVGAERCVEDFGLKSYGRLEPIYRYIGSVIPRVKLKILKLRKSGKLHVYFFILLFYYIIVCTKLVLQIKIYSELRYI